MSDIRQRALDFCRSVQLLIGAQQQQASRDVTGQLTEMVESLLDFDGERLGRAISRGQQHLSMQIAELEKTP